MTFQKLSQTSPYVALNTDFLPEEKVARALKNPLTPDVLVNAQMRSIELIRHIQKKAQKTSLSTFISNFDLNSKQGIALLCLAEALLRIPDAATRNTMIYDKFKGIPLSSSSHPLHKLASLGLRVGGWFLESKYDHKSGLILKLLGSSAEPFIEKATLFFVKKMGEHFVINETIEDAVQNVGKTPYRYSFDMLGESALTYKDAKRYFENYRHGLKTIAKHALNPSFHENPSLSIKLSALHPRYELLQRDDVMAELLPQVLDLCLLAKEHNMALTIDAEEADRLALSLELIAALNRTKALDGWNGLGLAVQAYQTRCLDVLTFLHNEGIATGRRFCVRLVKGAYWDTEIKRAQERGQQNYPVFTRKNTTDASYLAAAHYLLSHGDVFYPQFATHNAFTVSAVYEMAKGLSDDYEFQKLYGMGNDLYERFMIDTGKPCRVYAPVGYYHDLLPYLVRRLLENGANTSFVHLAENADTDALTQNPFERLEKLKTIAHPHIPLPKHIYKDNRMNALGFDLSNPQHLNLFERALHDVNLPFHVNSLSPVKSACDTLTFSSPNNQTLTVSHVTNARAEDVDAFYQKASAGFKTWHRTSLEKRATILNKMADLLEEKTTFFASIAILEAGKTVQDAISEVREAVDFLRYYALTGTKILAPQTLQGITGESNTLAFEGRGVFVCISPWNFPLAIFLGQISAALMAGNAVLAKPSEQTTAIAFEAVKLFYEAGLPKDALQLIIGKGSTVGAALVKHPLCGGVAFTGSTEVARLIANHLAQKEGPIVPFIAETGGQNAMIVDSTALPEQVVKDIIISGFQSAGQRCSALRIAFVHQSIFDNVFYMLCGAMDTLKVDQTQNFKTDIGPVIDVEAKTHLENYIQTLQSKAKRFHQAPCANTQGLFVAPHVFDVTLDDLPAREVFGPIIHMVSYTNLDDVLAWINASGYGLTLGIQSRIHETINHITENVKVGNIYVNRSMIGAVVGVQPFGGEGLSGTGPKAGSPYTLLRYASEKALSVNTTAEGGNRELLSLSED